MLNYLKIALLFAFAIVGLGIWQNGPGKLRAAMLVLIGIVGVVWGIEDFNNTGGPIYSHGVRVGFGKEQYLELAVGAVLVFGGINDMTLIRRKHKK